MILTFLQWLQNRGGTETCYADYVEEQLGHAPTSKELKDISKFELNELKGTAKIIDKYGIK